MTTLFGMEQPRLRPEALLRNHAVGGGLTTNAKVLSVNAHNFTLIGTSALISLVVELKSYILVPNNELILCKSASYSLPADLELVLTLELA